ncbi:MAG: phosphatase PAP2 family protein [Verrucomicrobiales bacterium]
MKILISRVFRSIGSLGLLWSVAAADVVTEWNSTLLGAVRTTSLNPPRASRQMAMMHLAIYDAVNGIEPKARPYLSSDSVPAAGSSKEAAVSAAAKVILDSFYSGNPTVAAAIAAQYEAAVAAVPDGPAKSNGLAWGTQVGNAMLTHRANDGSDAAMPYTPSNDVGKWRPTAPANAPGLLPGWGNVTPFAALTGAQFRPQQPPVLSSQAYTLEYQLTKDYGGRTSTLRTADQTEVALFWADGGGTETPPGHWMTIARGVSSERGLTLDENARLFALLGLGVADAAILCWDAKYVYDLWRPITAIQEGDNDGNSTTVGDPTWTPLIATPPFPEYTSGHSTFSRSSATVLAHFFGTDAIPFTTKSDGLPNVTRSYPGFSAAADESGISRVFGGIHFQSGNLSAQACGYSVALFLTKHYLTPLNALEFAQVNQSQGACALEILVTPGQAYAVEASSDFSTWEQIGVITSNTGVANFVDVNAPAGKRFYRARAQ